MTVPDNPVRMDIPAVRAARIELRVGELRVLVARTAVAVLALTPDGAWRRHCLKCVRSCGGCSRRAAIVFDNPVA